MHKDFYASGFLFHSPTQQILLQQFNSTFSMSSSWHLFGGLSFGKKNPQELFAHIILEKIGIKVCTVHSIYSYAQQDGRDKHILYAKLKRAENFPSKNGVNFAWFTFKEILKLKVMEQIKHDIIIGQRVIDSAERKHNGELTIG